MCSTELKWVSQGYRSGTRAPLIVNTAPTPATTSVQQSLTAVLKMAMLHAIKEALLLRLSSHLISPIRFGRYLDYTMATSVSLKWILALRVLHTPLGAHRPGLETLQFSPGTKAWMVGPFGWL